jgi:hypothetical protein
LSAGGIELNPKQERELWFMIRTRFVKDRKYDPSNRIEELAFQIHAKDSKPRGETEKRDDSNHGKSSIPWNEGEYIPTDSEKFPLLHGRHPWPRNFKARCGSPQRNLAHGDCQFCKAKWPLNSEYEWRTLPSWIPMMLL